jgi:hypothetical protein
MNQFAFTLKDNNQKAFNSFFWFLFFLHVVAVSVIIINAGDGLQKKIAIITFAIFLFLTALYFLFKSRFKRYSYQLLVLAVMICFWPAQSAWLPFLVVTAVIVFALAVLKTKSTAAFSNENIHITRSLFKKTYNWTAVENVVLKDNLLSIDFINNHLIQAEIATESYGIDEAAFNQFCQNQLQTLNPKP